MLTGLKLPDPKDQIDKRSVCARRDSDDSRLLLEHVLSATQAEDGDALREIPRGDARFVAAAPCEGRRSQQELFATVTARAELEQMSAATVDRYLRPARDRMGLKGISTTKPSPLLRNSVKVRTVADEHDDLPGAIEADTVAHCGH